MPKTNSPRPSFAASTSLSFSEPAWTRSHIGGPTFQPYRRLFVPVGKQDLHFHLNWAARVASALQLPPNVLADRVAHVMRERSIFQGNVSRAFIDRLEVGIERREWKSPSFCCGFDALKSCCLEQIAKVAGIAE